MAQIVGCRIWIGLALAIVLAASAIAQQQTEDPNLKAPPEFRRENREREGCISIINLAQFWVPGHVEIPSAPPRNFRLDPGKTLQICHRGFFYTGGKMYVVIKNWMALPVFKCHAAINDQLTLFARKQDEGYRYIMNCK
ncbi:MAG: hypothetical protein FJX52_09595 [Alphaproteobacteria bacterium]|nr:hypothetical protein [Alphaproteobacteria bacterium]